jgi:hypothetical protein
MEPVEIFLLVPTEDELPRARLISEGTHELGVVDGHVLEAQYCIPSGYLLVTSEGNPFEEGLHIYLLGPEFRILDRIALSAIYHSGIFGDVAISEEKCFEFTFFGGDRWRLTIRDTPKIHWVPKIGTSVRYPSGWLRRHYLQLDRLQ